MSAARGWEGQTILVTGAAGYIGSRLIRDLADDNRFSGATIRGLDNLQRATYGALMDLPSGTKYEFVEADLLDSASVRRALTGVEAVIHLAALVQTPFSFEHPQWTEHVNHWGTAHLAEQCVETGVERLIYASSASVYGPGGPFTETAGCKPIGPYSQSKLRAEEALSVAARRGLKPTIIRLATVFGDAPAVRFDAVPNRFAYMAAIGRPVTIHGAGDQVRALVHVADASEALRFCLAEPERTLGETFNWGSANLTIREMVDQLCAVNPASDVRLTDQHALAHFSLAVDSSKLRALGVTPNVDLSRGLAEILERLGPFATRRERVLVAVD